MTTLAHWCARWRFGILGGWIALLLGLAVALGVAGTSFTDATSQPNSESATAYALLEQANAHSPASSSANTTTGNVVWHTTGTAITDGKVRADVTAMLRRVAAQPGVVSVIGPYDPAGTGQLNPAANTAYARVTLTSTANSAAVVNTAEQLDNGTYQVEAGGPAFTAQPSPNEVIEAIGIAAALVLLLLVFRSLWAALLPIITGVAGVGVSLLLIMLASHVVNVASTSITLGTLIGLGVGIDYALFIVNRYRTGLMTGANVPGALAKAMATSGRAVIFAGVTVTVALLGMTVMNLGILTGMAEAAALTVLVTIAAALTLLPALLAILGRRVLSRRQRTALAAGALPPVDTGRIVGRWAGLVQRAPKRSAAGALLLLVAVALPALSIRVGDADASSDPAGSAGHAYSSLMSTGFAAGVDAPLLLVATTPDAGSTAAFTALTARLHAVDDVAAVSAAPSYAGQSVAVATVVPASSAQTVATTDLVRTLRESVIPAAEAGTGLHVYVGGTTATTIDLANALMNKLPLYLGLIALLGFVLLAVAFRSVLVPLVGAISNLATILAGLGVVTAVFQFGWGSQLLGVGSGAPVMYLVPVMIVGVMFGLSMDYQVFLVSRIREEWTRTRDNRAAVRTGMCDTARVIGTAATIMLFVFGSFGIAGDRIISTIGIGLAAAVLLDAFVVRMTLIPAVMTLLGRFNWSYPRWAARITPTMSIEDSPAPVSRIHELVAVGAQEETHPS
ncbi:MAG TPA: MMPL family transporter [Pseudonocardiaceae bacterium]|nr:MMPL family transporter [Pseudonocardiaceae bacterium]